MCPVMLTDLSLVCFPAQNDVCVWWSSTITICALPSATKHSRTSAFHPLHHLNTKIEVVGLAWSQVAKELHVGSGCARNEPHLIEEWLQNKVCCPTWGCLMNTESRTRERGRRQIKEGKCNIDLPWRSRQFLTRQIDPLESLLPWLSLLRNSN